jgi:flagella basal body P-ring formation protein FlgA
MIAVSAIALLAAATAAVTVQVRLPASVQLHGARLTLDELATVESASPRCAAVLRALDLGVAPIPGATQIVRAVELQSLIASQLQTDSECLPAFTGSATTVVSSEGQPVDMSDLARRAQAALEAGLAGHYDSTSVTEIEQSLRPFSVLPGTEFSFVVADAVRPRARMAVDVMVHEPQHGAWRYPIWFEVSAQQQAWQLDESVPAGRELREVRKHHAPVDVASLGSTPVIDEAALEDVVAKRPLSAGAVLMQDDLIRAPDVVAGREVALRYRNGGLEVQTQAIALQSGFQGDRVRVRNVRSSEEAFGYVDGRDDVQVTQ